MTRPVAGPARLATYFALGVAAIQLAWIFALPPFRGIDEFDHAYRAAGVAAGQWLAPGTPAAHGHGDYVDVPRPLVRAAHAVCESYAYTGHDNCNPAGPVHDGLVPVASGAARYNPVFYWVIGKPASLLSGAAFDYGLRVVASVLCAAFLWLAAYAMAVGFRTAWVWVAAALSLTPMFAYTVSLGAPNGIEMASALAGWAALLALRRPATTRTERVLICGASVAAGVLVTTRLLGPLWLVLLLAFTVPLLGRTRIGALLTRHRAWILGGGLFVAVALVAALVWNRIAAPNSLAAEPDLHLPDPLKGTLGQLPLWLFQSIGAFPMRNEPAPPVVYLAVLLLGAVLLTACIAAGNRRFAWVVGLAWATWLAVQVVITARTYAQLGPVWQGRYGLPFLCGIPLLMVAMAETRLAARVRRQVLTGVTTLVVVAQTVSVVWVLLPEEHASPLAHSSEWVRLPWVVVAVLAAAGSVVAVLPAWAQRAQDVIEIEPSDRDESPTMAQAVMS